MWIKREKNIKNSKKVKIVPLETTSFLRLEGTTQKGLRGIRAGDVVPCIFGNSYILLRQLRQHEIKTNFHAQHH